MKEIISLFILAIFVGNPFQEENETSTTHSADSKAVSESAKGIRLSAKKNAMEFIEAVFIDPNPEILKRHFSPNAIRKNGKPGSALRLIEDVKKKGPELVAAVELKAIEFFDVSELPRMQEKYSELSFLKGDRVPQYLKQGMACLFTFEHTEQKRIYKSIVVYEMLGNEQKIVYVDDEP